MAFFDSVIDVLVPRDANGRVLRDLIPEGPQELPECIVTRDTMCATWYETLMNVRQFRDALGEVFENWGTPSIERSLRRWPLGRNGRSDLQFSYRLWSMGWEQSPRLVVGPRFYGEAAERDSRIVPPVLLSADKQRIGAQRLYDARVLGRTWRQIADADALATGRIILDLDDRDGLADTIRQDVYRWERALGIPRRRRGRPAARLAPPKYYIY